MPVPKGSLVFYHANYPADIAIRIFSGSFFSHIGVANGDGSITCALFSADSVTKNYQDHYPNNEGITVVLSCPVDIDKLVAEMQLQLEKHYDYIGLLANPLYNLSRGIIKMSGGAPSKFHCSELVAWALSQVDSKITWNKPWRAITPDDVYKRFQ